MKLTITVNDYPIGWEWLANVPLEDFNWLIDIFATMTDNTDTYGFVFYKDSETLPGHLKRICSVDKISLANFLNEAKAKRNPRSKPNRYNHNRYNITTMNILYHIIRIILSLITILILIHNEKIYQAHKHTHPTNKIRYIISQTLILTLYTLSLILVSYTYRIILRYI